MQNKKIIAWVMICTIVLLLASSANGNQIDPSEQNSVTLDQTASSADTSPADDKYARIRFGKTNDILLLDIEWHTPESYCEEYGKYVDEESLKATAEEIKRGETYITKTIDGNSQRISFNSANLYNNAIEGFGNDPSEVDPDGYYVFNIYPFMLNIGYYDEIGAYQFKSFFGDEYWFVSSEEEFCLYKDAIRSTCDDLLEKGLITRELYEHYTMIQSPLDYYVRVGGLFGEEDLKDHMPDDDSLPPAPEPIKGRDHFSILYVGNSLLYSGNVPAQVSSLSQMYGITIDYDTIMPSGATLSDSMDQAIEKMQDGRYDYIIFQDHGSRPLWGERMNFFSDVKRLCEEARKTGAIPVLYNPAWYEENQKPNTADGHQGILTTAYENAAKINGAILVNAAEAWIYAFDKHSDIDLYLPNNYHANDAGAYLTACVFASTLFDLHIRDVADSNIYRGDDAVTLGQAAWEYVSYYNENKASPAEMISVPDGFNEKIETK